MDMQSILKNAVRAKRQDQLKTSTQLTLGELILMLEPIANNQEEIIKRYNHEAVVVFDFEFLFPTGISSWRGSYDELALTWDYAGYSPNHESPDHNNIEKMKVSEFLKMLKDIIGKELTGWKGGEFVMGKSTPIWVANDGNSGNTGLCGVINNEYEVVLETKRFEF